MPARRKVDREEFARLDEAGWSLQELAAHFGVAVSTVARVRKSLGLSRPAPALAPETVARVEEALADGWSFKEIHRTIGVDMETLRRRWPGRQWTKAEAIDYTRRLRWFREDVAKANYALSASDLRKSSFVA
ncbi:hypothetical protein ARTSIC4J27_558 [Pseudarthrobacter siccitolerans]|uniref:Uncharacterized protein n=1 Tax=Pseudarthrobacter siccitolerans TaxID=861266 RepID=A0A024GYS2_9MICC|nr:helix-turn-helix domain-containing protein [Pseudarthrobacter siccitolerans]CCQ44631.1 hypothetical protein ARTSIC4J27_558 [Pseudarthrobacter siccitolerans]